MEANMEEIPAAAAEESTRHETQKVKIQNEPKPAAEITQPQPQTEPLTTPTIENPPLPRAA
jgi:hypothetical protein